MGGDLRDYSLTFGIIFFIILTAGAVISRGDLRCQVFIFCNVDCGGKYTLVHEDITERRGEKNGEKQSIW